MYECLPLIMHISMPLLQLQNRHG